jgi:hypothetical protein
MQDDFIRALRGRRTEIRARWEALLRIERVNTPLANPDALVFMIDWTCDEIFAALDNSQARKRLGRGIDARSRAECPCGRNPLLIYFGAGEQALEEALVLEQASRPGLDPAERDAEFDELQITLREISRREIESFCAVCQYRASAEARAPEESARAVLAGAQPLPGPCSRSR